MKNPIPLTKKTAAIFGALALAGVLAAGGVAAAKAGHRHHDSGGSAERLVERIADKLSLDETQEDLLEEIAKAAAQKRKESREETKKTNPRRRAGGIFLQRRRAAVDGFAETKTRRNEKLYGGTIRRFSCNARRRTARKTRRICPPHAGEI